MQQQSEASGHVREAGEPDAIEAPGGAPVANGSEVRETTGESWTQPDSRNTTRVGSVGNSAQRRAPTTPTWTPRQRTAQALDARGETVDAICAACPTETGKPLPRSTLAAWRALPGWADALRHERASMAVETEALLSAGRLAAVRALVQTVEGDSADPNEVSSAARALLQASAPPGELVRARAAREARAAWLAALAPEAPDVRKRVIARLDGSLDDLPMAELEALAGEP